MRTGRVASLAVLGVVLATEPARACPMCRDSVAANTTAAAAGPTEAAAAPLDFNASVYVMLGVVAVVATAAGRAMVKAVRG